MQGFTGDFTQEFTEDLTSTQNTNTGTTVLFEGI